MLELGRPSSRLAARVLLAAALLGALPAATASSNPLGVFTNQGDVGSVSRPVAASYDASGKAYIIGASGANIWAGADAFGFAWRPVEGDIAIAADITFLGSSNQGHRKACLMFRQSLDPGSAYADVAVHGDGHIALQYRGEPGGPTRTIQCQVNAPQRVRLERRGPYVTVSVAGSDGSFS